MTTWTMDQVNQARGFRSRTTVDAELVERHGDDVRKSVYDRMAKQITHMAHSFAIELDARDFEVKWSDVEGEPWHVAADMRWWPSTRPIELRGGYFDGQRYGNFDRVGEPLRVPRPTPLVLDIEVGPDGPIADLADTYELVGWREDERVWVYEVRHGG